MKQRKGLMQILLIVAIIAMIISITNASQAAKVTAGSEKLLKINNPTARPLYENGTRTDNVYAYTAGIKSASGSVKEQHMWKIYEYNSNGTTIKNYNNGFYCLKMGSGFGSINGSTLESRSYDYSIDMKNPKTGAETTKLNNYVNGLAAETDYTKAQKYNSLVWVLDHCYVPGPSSDVGGSTEASQNAAAYRTELLRNAGIPSSRINDDLIDIVQQIAIWYFTNNDQYRANYVDSQGHYLGISNIKVKTPVSASYEPLSDVFGVDLQDDINKLFAYFVQGGIDNKNTAPSLTISAPVKFESSSVKAEELDANYYIAGPYKIEELQDAKNVAYTLEGNLVKVNETTGATTDVSYTILDSNKVALSSGTTLKDLVIKYNSNNQVISGQEFYLKINKNVDIEKAQFRVKWTIQQNNITYWTIEGSETAEQPVAEIVRNPKSDNIVSTISLSNFDLALRKFITKVNNVAVPTREPVISEESYKDLYNPNTATTTATKVHTKTPVSVTPGSTVLYTIRIYNEGSEDGYASKVVDYLPDGLTLKANSDINNTYGWTNPSNDGKTIETSYLADKLIAAQQENTTPSYRDLQVECVVSVSATNSNVSLKNVAEITACTNSLGNPVIDRDSIPNNLTQTQKTNYNPGTSEQGWGYEDDDDYEELLVPASKFDLSLRKYITNVKGIELKDATNNYVREPNVDTTPLQGGQFTADYKHQKDPVAVSNGDIVIYTIRVYNEGQLDGYASEITDHLPAQLEFVNDEFNASYGWQLDPSDNTQRTVKTSILARTEIDPEDNLLTAYDGSNTLAYKELKIKCKVVSSNSFSKVITNIAEISGCTDAEGNAIVDRDSTVNNAVIPSDENLPDYKGLDSNKSILTDKNYHYRGQEDDDDFEKLILEEFDLALRKFITGVNDTKITNRVPVFSRLKDENGNYIYNHTKEPVEVETADIVEYTIRIFNEGDIAGYAKEVKDDIPDGLEFLPTNETNIEFRWLMLDEDGEETQNVSEATSIVTDYLSKAQETATGRDNLIAAFDNSKTSPDYKDVKVAFKVIAPNSYSGVITNIAEISGDEDSEGKDVEDKDSTPDNNNPKEDDIDKEHIVLKYFDLALRKFITAVNDKEVTDRVPVFSIDENGNYVYNHTKEPVDVENGNIVTYTLRVYNEGTMAGYAKEVKDDIPEGLLFLPENNTNNEYRWVMLDKDGEETSDPEKAVSIVTDYLSKAQETATGRDNLLVKFDQLSMIQPDYRDLKVAFKVTEPNTSDRIIINHAQISDDEDSEGKDVIDKDSTPDKWIEGEDDQDIEKIKVKYFDLALRKWVTQAIVIENGKEVVTETGHKAEDDPEEVVKVDLKDRNYKNVVVKFLYKIRVTNEGQIAGYATEISDYIPEGLKFIQSENPEWKEVDGKIVTDQLKDTLLQPGESAEVEVLLTWINGKDNFGLKINTAEISKDKNDSNTPDIDSVPNNLKPHEDDIDDAPVILTVKTGIDVNMEIVGLVVVSLAIITTGTVLIKKFVL